jgi:hypothetical protein
MYSNIISRVTGVRTFDTNITTEGKPVHLEIFTMVELTGSLDGTLRVALLAFSHTCRNGNKDIFG